MPLNHTSKYAELTDQQFALLGRIMVEWSNIEFLLGELVSRLLLTPSFLGRVYTDEISGSRRQGAVRKALDIHTHRYGTQLVSLQLADEIAELNSELDQLRGARNRFAHFCWSRASDNEIFGTGFSGAVPQSKAAKKDTLTLTLAELEELYHRSYAAVDRLTALVKRVPETDEDAAIRTHIASQQPSGEAQHRLSADELRR